MRFIDVRDLAEWTIRLAEQRITGMFKAGSPALPITMREMLAAIAQGVRADAELVWVPTALPEGE
ncbi:MAG: hypothetical protein J2P48_16770 [Alphaproteobacteria bacterium]|nr:hypothetical protein [Alphaproteobacteria bacterium]